MSATVIHVPSVIDRLRLAFAGTYGGLRAAQHLCPVVADRLAQPYGK
ncbi:hypothetical protein [Nocardia alba]|uniref:Uncharacterized protein n=1 Tax=Nocardia alba TaxID=225051 RepID=A0A4R1G1W5_9NOCA|nr:hypothetical protein [Nocardia alba]TCK00253.1 hypothetical protein DFR71_1251 [Nocardia alba]